jgi:hypothetical protein
MYSNRLIKKIEKKKNFVQIPTLILLLNKVKVSK